MIYPSSHTRTPTALVTALTVACAFMRAVLRPSISATRSINLPQSCCTSCTSAFHLLSGEDGAWFYGEERAVGQP